MSEGEEAVLQARQDTRVKRITEHMTANPAGASKRQLEVLLGGKAEQVRTLVDTLVEQGVLARSGSGRSARVTLATTTAQQGTFDRF